MNIFQKLTRVVFPVLALAWAGGVGLAQPVLTISPSVTSNTYLGVITLSITGLTNGEAVVVRKYLDLNASGSIDAGEPLVDAFKIADGGVMMIGGVTNLNVPFDSNPAPGAITTALNFVPAMILETMVAHYVYEVSSPSGRFTAVTAPFVVTNAALAQSLSGTIYSNGVPLPYGVVVAQDQQANNPVGAVVADSTGHYFLAVPPSSYTLIATMPNCYFDMAQAPSVTLTNGIPSTNDVYVTNGTVSISGSFYDAGNSNGIGGLLMTLQSGSLFAISFTDSKGDYSAAVTSSFWKIQPSKERFARRAYVYPEVTFQVDTTSGNVSNANLALPKGNALFYGRITDNSGQPFVNIQLDANANGPISYDAKGYSDSQGYYAVAVLGDLTNYWSCGVYSGKNTAISAYVVNTFSTITMAPNQATQESFVALPATGRIHGHVQDTSGNPVTGVALDAGALINGNNYEALDSTTDPSGNYSLAVADGTWSVQFLTGGFSDNLDTHGYMDPFSPHWVTVPPEDVTLNLTVYPIGTPIITSPQRFGSSQFGFTINGASNVTYTVQVSTNLAATNWTPLFSLILTNNPFPVVDIHATNSPRFYRVLKN